MAYLKDNFIDDLVSRKEFAELRTNVDDQFRNRPDPFAGQYLKSQSYQLFVRNMLNPNTPYKSLHLMHSTGIGKTISSVLAAHEYIKVYRRIYNAQITNKMTRRSYAELSRSTPNVFVLGFSGPKAAFIRELLRYPEFGFVSYVERDELTKRQVLAASGSPTDIKYYKDYHNMLKRRITNKSRGGFYTFYGYDEMVNRLFLSDTLKLIDLDTEFKVRHARNEMITINGVDNLITLEDIFRERIASGDVRINMQLLESFRNSFVICDEIPHTYNMSSKNNRGVALQYIIDSKLNITLLTMSATPINNSPTEVVEIMNYHIPTKVTKRDLFASPNKLRPGKLEEIGRLTRGYFSFVQDSNIQSFPKRTIVGDDITIPIAIGDLPAGSKLPYLKFVQCEMSELHQRTYNNYVDNGYEQPNDITEATTDAAVVDMAPVDIDDIEAADYTDGINNSYHSIPIDGYAIFDMVIPSPDNDIGLFRASDIRNKIMAAPQSWRDANGIIIKKVGDITVLSGSFLKAENLPKCSAKYSTILNQILEIIASAAGDANKCRKMMYYHNRVRTSGVLMMQEILRVNNILDETSEPIETTICCLCGVNMRDHGNLAANIMPHAYKPARFIIAHSDIDKTVMDTSIYTKYNSVDNCRGLNWMILVGSKIIKESYDIKSVRVVFLGSLPINIPTMLQVFGRSSRKNSHIDLPLQDRNVEIFIFISTTNAAVGAKDPMSPEIYRYAEKLSDYLLIQLIEREINRNAIDAHINRGIVMSKDILANYFPEGNASLTTPVAGLGNLYFDIPPSKIAPPESARLITFNAYKYYEEELRTLTYLIKYYFTIQRVWTYDNLLAAVRDPSIAVEIDPNYLSEDNFVIAISNLCSVDTKILSDTTRVERMFDYSDRNVYINDCKYKIVQRGKYYILFPIIDDKIFVDIDMFITPPGISEIIVANVNSYLHNHNDVAYHSQQSKMLACNCNQFLYRFNNVLQMRFIEEAIIDCIKHNKIRQMYDFVVKLMISLDVIILCAEVKKYRNVPQQFTKFPSIDDKIPIGYMTNYAVRLYDDNKWIEVSKVALNRQIIYRENPIIIGYFDTNEDQMRFKLRKPASPKVSKDTRLIEHGIVCETKNREDLLFIARQLGLFEHVPNLLKTHVIIDKSKVKNICGSIRDRLIELEIHERTRDTMAKYLYSWWNDQTEMTLS